MHNHKNNFELRKTNLIATIFPTKNKIRKKNSWGFFLILQVDEILHTIVRTYFLSFVHIFALKIYQHGQAYL